jgi:putative N-acetyltransferase (TIGR04045 family)
MDPIFTTRRAGSAAELAAYFALRRQIFCAEQGVFSGDDRDSWDDNAHAIVCLDDREQRVVGVVRIWEDGADHWWGGRLGVHPDFRAAGGIGRALVLTAVGTARAWGAQQFRATVQRPNVAFFRRLHWQTLETLELFGQPHHLMQADLDRYPPLPQERPARTPRGIHVAA